VVASHLTEDSPFAARTELGRSISHANFCAVDGMEKSLKRTENDMTVRTLSLCSMPISILKSHAQRNLEGSWRVIAVAVTPDGRSPLHGMGR